MLVLAGCVAQTAPSAEYPAPAQTQMAQGAPQSEPQNCRSFTAQVTVGGQPQQAVGQACQQADGSWQVTQNTPGLPQQVYTLPPQAIHLYPYPEPYYWWDPWFYGPSFFGGSVFSSMVFTISMTMMGSTTVAFPIGVSRTAVLPTAAFTEAGGERQAPRCKSGRPRPRCAPASDRRRPRVEIAHVTGRSQRPRCRRSSESYSDVREGLAVVDGA